MATINQLRVGPLTVGVENAEGQSLKQVLADFHIKLDGATVVLNGDRLSDDELETAVIHDDDEVDVAEKVDNGV